VSDDDRGADAPAEAPLDVVVPRAPTEDGKGVHVVRLRERTIELGEVRPLEDGRPVAATADVVRLSPRDDAPAWNVEVLVPRTDPPARPPSARRGPPQVATAGYRRNWEAMFGDPDDLN
jgi:hypothetical protein